ncbi:hypothetical protein [Agrobacterium sp. B1(2019)]|uniref:hypothetical protein n=1 Tax=Agrobacterium sp. B1(2019) TaxID=2607032 RepID=UPI001FEE316A|nr:hypothetical protein [Agrobacterium sp. B1(2019)]
MWFAQVCVRLGDFDAANVVWQAPFTALLFSGSNMMTLQLSRFACLSVFLLFLAGCMTVPISSIPKLMRQDFLTMDFEHVRVGLQLPANLSLRSGDAVMITRSKTDGATEETVETYALVADTDAAALAKFRPEKRDGMLASVWRVKPEDVGRLAELQERVRRSRAQGPRIRGSTAIKIVKACFKGTFPAGPIYSSIYMKPAENEDYIPTSLDADLVKLFGPTAVRSLITPCEG